MMIDVPDTLYQDADGALWTSDGERFEDVLAGKGVEIREADEVLRYS